MSTLRELGFAGDAMSEPLSYPGPVPDRPALLDGDDLRWLRIPDGESIAGARVEYGPGDDVALPLVLLTLGTAALESRRPVLAIGSNASPGQLVRKLRGRGVGGVVPLAPATVDGIAIGFSAHVSRWGYLAAAPLADPHASGTEVGVLWLDGPQRRALDLTEPNYAPLELDGEGYPVTLRSGARLDGCTIYAGRWGVLLDRDGAAYRRQPQERLIGDLLERSAELTQRFGPNPAAFARTAAADRQAREEARELFRRLGWVGDDHLCSGFA